VNSLLPLVTFVFVCSITPGPNNLMLAASGVGFGLRRTLPHIAGVSVGFVLLLITCGLGVGALLTGLDGSGVVLKFVGSGYLVYLAWTLRAGAVESDPGSSARPMSLLGAAAFQFINPKAWLMALTCIGVFVPGIGGGWSAVLLVAAVATAVNLPCVSTWAFLGSSIRNLLDDPRWLGRFNALMVLLTLYAALAVWL